MENNKKSDNDKVKQLVLALECVIFFLAIVMLGLTIYKAHTLSVRVSKLEADTRELKERADKAEFKTEKKTEASAEQETLKDESVAAAAAKAKDETKALQPTATPKPTSTPLPTQAPAYLPDLNAYKPGDIIEDSMIDQADPGKYFTSSGITEGDAVFERINNRSFRYNDNIALSDLRYIKLIHKNFNDQTQVGELIVNAAIEADVIDIFMQFYMNGYQICSMYLIDNYWAGDGDSSDYASIEEDNTSAFCYRTVTGSSNLSNHAYGLAIDLNPLENPYVRIDGDGYGTSAHANAQAYNNDRSSATPRVIDHDDLAYRLFTEHGFTWGGDWDNPKDYQHFQKELF